MKPNRFLLIFLGVISFLHATRSLIAENQIDLQQREANIDSIAADFTTKFRAKAPAKDYDALLQHIAALGSLPTRDAVYLYAKINILQKFISSWQDYLIYSPLADTDQEQQALRDLAELSVNSWPQLPPRSELLAVINDAQNRIAVQIKAKHAATTARFEVFRTKLTSALTDAKSTTELDPLITEISGIKEQLGPTRYDEASSSDLAIKIAASERLLKLWQERLAALSQGDIGTAWSCSQKAAEDDMIRKIFPRSIFLKFSTENLASFVPKSIDDLPNALKALPPPNSSDKKYSDLDALRTILNQYASVYRLWSHSESAKGLDYLITTQYPSPDGADYALIDRIDFLREALILRLLTVTLELPSDCQPAEKEHLAAFVNRAEQFAGAHQDWRLLANVLEIGHQLDVFPMAGLPDERAAQLYLTAINQEKASLFADAAANYRRIASMSVKYVPLDDLILRLKRIKTEHPADFAESEEILTRNSSMQRFAPRYNGMPRPGFQNHSPEPGAPLSRPAAPSSTSRSPAPTTVPAAVAPNRIY